MQSLKTGYEYDHSGDDIDDAHCYGIRAPGICKFFCIFSIENIHADCTDYTLDNDGADIFIDDDEEDREEEHEIVRGAREDDHKHDRDARHQCHHQIGLNHRVQPLRDQKQDGGKNNSPPQPWELPSPIR